VICPGLMPGGSKSTGFDGCCPEAPAPRITHHIIRGVAAEHLGSPGTVAIRWLPCGNAIFGHDSLRADNGRPEYL